MEKGDKYIWRFKIESGRISTQPHNNDCIVEMVKNSIEALLEIVVLTKNGEEVIIDGFKFHNSLTRPNGKEYKIYKD